MNRLQVVYKNALELRYDNSKTRANGMVLGVENVEVKTAYQLFEEFFKERNNCEMTSEQKAYVKSIIDKIEEGEA